MRLRGHLLRNLWKVARATVTEDHSSWGINLWRVIDWDGYVAEPGGFEEMGRMLIR